MTTIEQLFISPVEAARERTRERLSLIAGELAQLTEADDIVRKFVTVYQRQRAPQLSASARTANETVTITQEPPALAEGDSKTARVRSLAVERGVS